MRFLSRFFPSVSKIWYVHFVPYMECPDPQASYTVLLSMLVATSAKVLSLSLARGHGGLVPVGYRPSPHPVGGAMNVKREGTMQTRVTSKNHRKFIDYHRDI